MTEIIEILIQILFILFIISFPIILLETDNKLKIPPELNAKNEALQELQRARELLEFQQVRDFGTNWNKNKNK